MKVEDLRIGNYLTQIDQNGEKELTYVYGIISDVINPLVNEDYHGGAFGQKRYYQGWNYEPIPLDDEIMERLGFSSKWTKGVFGVATTSEHSDYVFYQECEENGIAYFPKPLKYVHELQNMYYALTDEELTVNEI